MLSNGPVRVLLTKRKLPFCSLYLRGISYHQRHSLFPNISRKEIESSRTTAMVKRKSSALAQTTSAPAPLQLPSFENLVPPPPKRRASQRKAEPRTPLGASTNPDRNSDIFDGPEALRASPDAEEKDERFNIERAGIKVDQHLQNGEDSTPSLIAGEESSLSELSEAESSLKDTRPSKSGTIKGSKKSQAAVVKGSTAVKKEPQFLDPEADGEEEADEEEIQAALSRPPPVNSDYLPLPWKGRLGYVGHIGCPLTELVLIDVRLVYVPTYGSQIHRSSARGLAESLRYWRIDIL